jgi:TonB family protein
LLQQIHSRIVMLAVAIGVFSGAAGAQQTQWPPATPYAAPSPAQAPARPAVQGMPQAGQAPTPWPARPAAAPTRLARATGESEERAGTLETHNGLRLRLETDIGSVRIFTDAIGQVRYRVLIQTGDRGAEAQQNIHQFNLHAQDGATGVVISGQLRPELRERMWVTYELHVPRTYNIDVTTQAGNIQMDDIDGRISLITRGGNISAGKVSGGSRQQGIPSARLESRGGGHISVMDVTGDLRAVTVGGHITAGNVSGDAMLSTGGGHIHAGSIGGVAQLETGGGNISVERAGSRVTASSGGGQISFGEAAGAIQARTTGGGIRVLRVAGPMQLDSNGGSIFLTKVENSVHASTGTGSITAWLSPSLKVTSGSQLESGQGDIVVYVPRKLQVTIEATIDTGLGHHIVADPSLPMKITYLTGDSGKEEKGECAINGGGEILRLRAMQGNIQLRYMDEAFLRQQELIQQQIHQEIEMQQRMIQTFVLQSVDEMNRQMLVLSPPATPAPMALPATAPRVPVAQPGMMPPPAPATPALPPTEIMWMKLGEFWWGGVRVDPIEQETRRIVEVRPVYPEIARQSGIEGTVSMRVLINKDGAVEKVDVLSGEQALQDDAVAAVRRWRYKPFLLEDKPVPVVTVVNLEFRLH